ncbi:hypothetical protein C8R47DRAFT_1230730 [Mycena vitilis]|nr:hypothetical protein C8R47DRAFT_1230730 [Mycena vitilis]
MRVRRERADTTVAASTSVRAPSPPMAAHLPSPPPANATVADTTVAASTSVRAPSPPMAARPPSAPPANATVAALVEDADVVQEAGPRPPQGPVIAPRLRSMIRRHRQEAAAKENRFYLTAVRPPEIPEGVVVKDQHECDICFSLKFHPVSYRCGHSHCYVCIRQALERSVKCPSCMTPMSEPPFRHWGEEKGIRADYPTVVDKSEVNYSFNGVIFSSK